MNLMDKGKFETKRLKFLWKNLESVHLFLNLHTNSHLYMIFSAIIAIGLGISAGLIFKRN